MDSMRTHSEPPNSAYCSSLKLTPRQIKAKFEAYLLDPHWALKVCPPGDRWTASAASQNASTSVLYLEAKIAKVKKFQALTLIFL